MVRRAADQAIDLESGRLRAFTRADGYPLLDAVSASGAVPGISPPWSSHDVAGSTVGWSPPPTRKLAERFDEILVIAPLPRNHGGVPSVDEEVELLSRDWTIHLIVPDGASRAGIGPSISPE